MGKEYHFPKTLTAAQRQSAHDIAHELGLDHKTVGKQKRRHVVVTKKKPPKPDTPARPAEKTAIQPRKEKKKKKKVTPDGEEDLDELLKEFKLDEKSQKQCAFKGCKRAVHTISTTCKYCHLKFCGLHGNPVFHDPDRKYCADAQRKVKR